VIREQTQRDVLALPVDQRNEIQEKSKCTSMYWGYFWHELNHTQGPAFDAMTLADVSRMELSAIERILTRALPNVK
jgi:hypothetical protein